MVINSLGYALFRKAAVAVGVAWVGIGASYAQSVAVDRLTGHVRPMEHDNLQTNAQAVRATARAAMLRNEAVQAAMPKPQGVIYSGAMAKGRVLDANRLNYTVVRVGKNGELERDCVTGESGLRQWANATSSMQGGVDVK
ncbi:MAG TPA: hypothetical protein VFS42_05190 [Burkholderiaceae bacterium]|nr:hypothetical protein [Burkholderiaceae bacterium]